MLHGDAGNAPSTPDRTNTAPMDLAIALSTLTMNYLSLEVWRQIEKHDVDSWKPLTALNLLAS